MFFCFVHSLCSRTQLGLKTLIKNLAEQLWETSIKDKYSIIGEFSSSTDLRCFIIKSASKILMDTSKLEKHTITDVSLVCPYKLKEIIKNGKRRLNLLLYNQLR